jgi:hypothetical protein
LRPDGRYQLTQAGDARHCSEILGTSSHLLRASDS